MLSLKGFAFFFHRATNAFRATNEAIFVKTCDVENVIKKTDITTLESVTDGVKRRNCNKFGSGSNKKKKK